MANPIDLIVTSEAIKGVDALIAKVTSAREGLLLLGDQALASAKNVSKISTPSGLNANSSDNARINADLQRQSEIIKNLSNQIKLLALAKVELTKEEAKNIDNIKKVNSGIVSNNNVVASNIRLNKLQQAEIEKNNRLKEKERVLVEKNTNAYNKTQAQINKLTVAYNDLALRKERYNNLSANEEMRLATLGRVTEKYNGILKQTDAIIGKNQRNVGNYASGYNALGNSINQLSREAPAFANSVNTGFMALSNNFPALFDAINGIRAQNKALIAEGKPTVSLFKQLVSGIFSWQTLLSVGVTLLTLYGGKMVEYVMNLSSGAKAQNDLNNAVKEGNKNAYKEAGQLDILYKVATNVNLTLEQRKKAVDKLQAQYPSYFANIADEVIMNGKAKNSYLDLRDAIFASARAKAIQTELEKRAEGRIEKEIKITEELAEAEKEVNRLKKSGNDLVIQGSAQEKTVTQRVSNKDLILAQERLVLLKRKELNKLEKEALEEDKILLDAQAKNEKKSERLEADRINAPKVRKSTIEKKEEAEALKGTEKWFNQQIAKLKEVQSATADTTQEYKEFTKQIEALERALEALRNGNKFAKPNIGDTSGEAIPSTVIAPKADKDANEWMKQYAEDVKKAEEETRKLREATDNFLASFSSEFLQNSGLGSFETFFDGTFDKLLEGAETVEEKFAVTFNAIAESAQEAFNFIANASQANFDNERKRIEDQQAIAISYAGGSATAIAKINEDAEKRKKEVANRENKAKQKQALFNIAIDTAQGIVSALASTPPNVPLSVAIGVLGAVQIGLVASQKVPQYFDGTDNHTGGLMLVNDGKGANYQEKVILPNGKEIMPQGRNVLMDAPKGTKVLTHEQQLFEMMQSKGIAMSSNYTKANGMTAQEMDGVLAKHFSKIQTNVTTFDQNGIRSWSESNGNKTIRNNNRVSRTGYSV